MRVAFRWYQLRTAAGAYDLRVSDGPAVAAAVARGMQVLPVIEQTPGWAATRPGDLAAAPEAAIAVPQFRGPASRSISAVKRLATAPPCKPAKGPAASVVGCQ